MLCPVFPQSFSRLQRTQNIFARVVVGSRTPCSNLATRYFKSTTLVAGPRSYQIQKCHNVI